MVHAIQGEDFSKTLIIIFMFYIRNFFLSMILPSNGALLMNLPSNHIFLIFCFLPWVQSIESWSSLMENYSVVSRLLLSWYLPWTSVILGLIQHLNGFLLWIGEITFDVARVKSPCRMMGIVDNSNITHLRTGTTDHTVFPMAVR